MAAPPPAAPPPPPLMGGGGGGGGEASASAAAAAQRAKEKRKKARAEIDFESGAGAGVGLPPSKAARKHEKHWPTGAAPGYAAGAGAIGACGGGACGSARDSCRDSCEQEGASSSATGRRGITSLLAAPLYSSPSGGGSLADGGYEEEGAAGAQQAAVPPKPPPSFPPGAELPFFSRIRVKLWRESDTPGHQKLLSKWIDSAGATNAQGGGGGSGLANRRRRADIAAQQSAAGVSEDPHSGRSRQPRRQLVMVRARSSVEGQTCIDRSSSHNGGGGALLAHAKGVALHSSRDLSSHAELHSRPRPGGGGGGEAADGEAAAAAGEADERGAGGGAGDEEEDADGSYYAVGYFVEVRRALTDEGGGDRAERAGGGDKCGRVWRLGKVTAADPEQRTFSVRLCAERSASQATSPSEVAPAWVDGEDLPSVRRADLRLACAHCEKHQLLLAELPLFCDYCKRAMQRPTRKYYQESEEAARNAGANPLRLCNSCFQRLRQLDCAAQSVELQRTAHRASAVEWAEFEEQLVPLREGEGPVLCDEDRRWVQCEKCNLWYHFVCGLYDGPALGDMESRFYCVTCTQADASGQLRESAAWVKYTADSLPHTNLSRHVEEALAHDLAEAGIAHEPVRIRLISSKIEQSHCPEEMVQRMFALGGPYPSEFPYRSKALVAFQRHEGIDVAFFAMYVQEYGDDCPEPNKNRVYISYLDSVRYFTCSRPNQRTLVYHSILVAYLAYVRVLGFKWVHIWVEPPKAGDEYIFFARPDQHKRPMKRDKLRAWYVAMLERAKEKDVVRKFGSMADVYSEMSSIREIPMFHGDQWAITIPELLSRIEQEHQESGAGGVGGSRLHKLHAQEVVQRAQLEIQHLKRHFLVAQLRELECAPKTDLDPEVTNELANSREVLLGHCQTSHWQFNSPRFAQYSTMMLLNHFTRKPRLLCTPDCTRGRKEDGSKMVGCDACDNWYHTACVSMTADQADAMKSYVCPQCTEAGLATGGYGAEASLSPSQQHNANSSPSAVGCAQLSPTRPERSTETGAGTGAGATFVTR